MGACDQEGDASLGGLEDACAELREGPRELAELYNDYAAPWRAWGLGLRMVALAGYSDGGYVRQLWDVYLRQARAPIFGCPRLAGAGKSIDGAAWVAIGRLSVAASTPAGALHHPWHSLTWPLTQGCSSGGLMAGSIVE